MSFIGKFFLLVLFVGFAELYLLIHVSSRLGFLTTLGICVLTGVVGGSLVRAQGLRTLRQIKAAASRGEVPAVEIVSGLVLLLVGAMLIMPGFVTDVLGFLMLVPGLRTLAAAAIARRFREHLSLGGPMPFARGSVIIDAEAEPAEYGSPPAAQELPRGRRGSGKGDQRDEVDTKVGEAE